MELDAIFFDFGGTLDADGLPWNVRFHQAFAAEGVACAFSEFEAHFRASDRDLAHLPGIAKLGFWAMVDAQAKLVGRRLGLAHREAAKRAGARFHAAALETLRRNRILLTRLRRHYRLGIISNFTGNLATCLEEIGLAPMFDAVADSGLIGRSKPDPGIYAWALDRMDVDASCSAMIGDNFEYDIRPAALLGMSAYWLAAPDRALPEPGVARARATRLLDLVAVCTE